MERKMKTMWVHNVDWLNYLQATLWDPVMAHEVKVKVPLSQLKPYYEPISKAKLMNDAIDHDHSFYSVCMYNIVYMSKWLGWCVNFTFVI